MRIYHSSVRVCWTVGVLSGCMSGGVSGWVTEWVGASVTKPLFYFNYNASVCITSKPFSQPVCPVITIGTTLCQYYNAYHMWRDLHAK